MYFCLPASFLQHLVRVFFGCLAAVSCGMLYAVYLSTYHDRKFWFSKRQVCDWFLNLIPTSHPPHCPATLFSVKHESYVISVRSSSVKSPSRKAAASITTTTNACWQRPPLKEVWLLFQFFIVEIHCRRKRKY